jgi:hypothetical protein
VGLLCGVGTGNVSQLLQGCEIICAVQPYGGDHSISTGDFLAKSSRTSAKTRRSSGKVQANDMADPLARLKGALEVMGRTRYPLDPALLLEQELVLESPAVMARAGLGAPPDRLAQAASEVLREIVTDIRDDTDRHVAEAALATDSSYEGKGIKERQDLLYERYKITTDIYADHRRPVFWKITYELRAYRSSPQTYGITPVQSSEVGATATRLYYASIATKVLITDRARLLGDDVLLLREPNLPLYFAHVTFLLTAHRYLHTIDAVESVARPELTSILQQVIANGPLKDLIYLAHIYGGRDQLYYPPGAPDAEADRLLRTIWRDWYEGQEANAEVGSELHSLSIAVLQFRNTLPMIDTLHPSNDFLSNELEPAIKFALRILRDATTYKSPIRHGVGSDQPTPSRVLSDVLGSPEARNQWLFKIGEEMKIRARWELRNAKADKRWDDLIAERLHSQA